MGWFRKIRWRKNEGNTNTVIKGRERTSTAYLFANSLKVQFLLRMNLYAVCEPWLTALGVWPLKKFGWMFKCYFTLSVMYLLVPEMIYLYRNISDVELFGSCFCEMMVVCQGLYKLLILIYHKHNWRIVVADISQVFKECED